MADHPSSSPIPGPESNIDSISFLNPVQQEALQRQQEVSRQAAHLHQENVDLKASVPPGNHPLPVSGPLHPDVTDVLKTAELQANVERLKVENQNLEEEKVGRVGGIPHFSSSITDSPCLKVEYACHGCKSRVWLTDWRFFSCGKCGFNIAEKLPDGK